MTLGRAFISDVGRSDSEAVDRALGVVSPTHAGTRVTSLLVRAKAGERAALETIARDELPRVERLLRRLLGRRGDMDDLVQTVFLEMCRALPGFRGDSAFSTFVGGITVRVARRALRPAAWDRLRVRDTEGDEDAHAGPDRPDDRAHALEQLRRVQVVLDGLTAPKREAFVLWAFEGLEVERVAQVVGASVPATRSRIFYAQKELKAAAAADAYLKDLLEAPDAG